MLWLLWVVACNGTGKVDSEAAESSAGCDDGGQVYFADADGDGEGDAGVTRVACGAEAGWAEAGGDCDDGDASVYSGAAEVCDGADNDCDGIADDSPVDLVTSWRDGDGDGYGDAESSYAGCGVPEGYVEDATDCDDGRASVSPAGIEACDGQDLDEDCDGLADNDDPDAADETRYMLHPDRDGDGYGAAEVIRACDPADGLVEDGSDCDDDQPSVSPGAVEVCDPDNVDEDCDGRADDADDAAGAFTWYQDSDGDGWGVLIATVNTCDVPAGYVDQPGDCNDLDASTRPGGQEVCDILDADEDCSGVSDDNDATATGQIWWYLDSDADDYGAGAGFLSCNAPFGYIWRDGDCDNGEPLINPDAAEICGNTTDEDCSGAADGC